MNKKNENKIENLEREKYWNEDYVAYWKERVEEANLSEGQSSTMVKGDSKTSADKLYFEAINLLNIQKTENLLEIGCGFGRSLPSLSKLSHHVCAVDISTEMIASAKEFCQEENVSFYVSPSEKLPFSDNKFDVVVCYAAFDAMYQMEALLEINRVCKLGARVLITGKNDNYFDDDSAALAAEIGASSKGHPNYFTDVNTLLENLNVFGFQVEIQKYFSRRGNFADGIAITEKPNMFYEYLFTLKKIRKSYSNEELIISSNNSKTYLRNKIK